MNTTGDTTNARLVSRLWNLLPRHGRVLLPLAAAHLAVLVLLRGMFFLAFRSSFPALSGEVLGKALWIGAKFDLRLVLLTLLPLALVGWVRWLSPVRGRFGRQAWTVYLGVAAALTAVAYAVDFGYFAYVRARLSAQVFDLMTEAGIAAGMVWETYPVVWITLAVAGAVAVYVWFVRRLIATEAARTYLRPARWPRAGLVAAVVFVWGFGIWGKAQWYPLRWSDAFFATDEWSAALGLNPVLLLADTYKNRARGFDEAALRERYAAVAAYLGVDRPDPATLTFRRETAGRPLAGRRPNIVVILLESASHYKTGAFGNPLGPTPHLDALARDGILFTRYLAPAFGTARSVFALMTGIPDVERQETASRNPLIVRQHTIANAFEGYEKLYFLGGSLNWGNVRGILAHNVPGLRLYEEGSYTAPRVDVWGISDLALFEEANAVLREVKGRPFFAVIQTSGHHRPYTIPDHNRGFVPRDATAAQLKAGGFEELDEYNSYRFMDHALGAFVADARREAYFPDTIFVMFGDHGLPGSSDNLAPAEVELGLVRFHVPAVIYGKPLAMAPRVIEAPASEVDVLPTLASLAGVPYVNTALGRDLFDPRFDATRFAFTIADHATRPKIGLLLGDVYLQMSATGENVRVLDVRGDGRREVTSFDPGRKEELARLCRGLYEASRWLMYHNAPPGPPVAGAGAR